MTKFKSLSCVTFPPVILRAFLVVHTRYVPNKNVAEALEEAMHRPDPVALESAPGLAYVAIFVGRVGHFRQELVSARAHLAPESEAQGQELASLSVANWPVQHPARSSKIRAGLYFVCMFL